MIIYPAIDIKDGKCVRLVQGDMDKATVYHDNPVDAALRWQSFGAGYLHIVDLNGAVNGQPENRKAIKEIAEKVKIPVQLGGGIRDMDILENLLNTGIHRAILGTAALRDREFVIQAVDKYPSRIVVGVDARDGYVAVEGWQQVSRVKALDFAREIQDIGVETIIFTDISRDGMMEGPNIDSIEKMVQGTRLEVIASGGIRNVQDLTALKEVGAEGAVIGKALYTGNIDLREALQLLKEE